MYDTIIKEVLETKDVQSSIFCKMFDNLIFTILEKKKNNIKINLQID